MVESIVNVIEARRRCGTHTAALYSLPFLPDWPQYRRKTTRSALFAPPLPAFLKQTQKIIFPIGMGGHGCFVQGHADARRV